MTDNIKKVNLKSFENPGEISELFKSTGERLANIYKETEEPTLRELACTEEIRKLFYSLKKKSFVTSFEYRLEIEDLVDKDLTSQ